LSVFYYRYSNNIIFIV